MADEEVSALLDVIGHAADILGVVLPAVSLIGDVIKWFEEASGGPDPIIASLAKVDVALGELQDEVLATWAAARRDNLAFLAANSTAAMQTALNFMQSGADASNPEWAANIALAQTNSLVAVTTFVSSLDTGYWRRPYSIKAISQDGDPTDAHNGWMTYLPDRAPKDSDNTVWDYRWGLPATVYAITARLVVLRLIGWDPAATLREVGQYNEFIAQVYQRMDAGIRSLGPPSTMPDNFTPSAPPTFPLAVADIYGGYFIAGAFPSTLTPSDLGSRPYPPGGIVPDSGWHWPIVVQNAKLIIQWWRDNVATTVGLPNLLQFAGRLENALHPPSGRPSSSAFLFHFGDGALAPGQPFTYGVFYRVSLEGDLIWYKYEGAGESDPSGNTGWNDNSGNPIGNGWANFKFLLGAGNGVILSVEQNGDMRWRRYVGNGESDLQGDTGWAANSGNLIGTGWNNFNQLVVQPGMGGNPIVIYGVLPNGDLVWHVYTGQGENDPTGKKGWGANSGNRIGKGWQTSRLFFGGEVIFAIPPSGELRWYCYQGDGRADVSGATGWHPNSGNVIATNWGGYRNVFSGLHQNSSGEAIFAVDGSGNLYWFHYVGSGAADPTGHTGWGENYGSCIGNGW